MKLSRIVLAIGLSFISLSSYAADQVVKEETTASAPEGAITADQIPALYSPPPTAQQAAPQTPTETNQPVAPSNIVPPSTQSETPQNTPAQQPADTMQQGNMQQEGAMQQGTLPPNTPAGGMPQPLQQEQPQQQQNIQQNNQQPIALTPPPQN